MIASSVRLAAAAVAVGLVVAGCSSNAEEAGSTSPDPNLIEDGALTVCTNVPYPPWEFKQNDEYVGFDVDLVKEVARRLQVRPEFVNVDFKTIETGRALNGGKCDVAVAALSINGQRARALDFSSPYFDAGQAMVVEEDSGITSLDDLDGLKVGVQDGSTGQLYVADNAPRDTEIVPLADAAQINAALDNGEVDAAVYDNTLVKDVLRQFPEFEVAAEFSTGEQYGMAVEKNGNVDLLRVINDVLAELRDSGRYDAIYEQWIGPIDQA